MHTATRPSFIAKCPWCKSLFTDAALSNCKNCGGSLEHQYGRNTLGLVPPPAPRSLPSHFTRRIKYTSNVFTMLGIFFTIPFIWTVIFPIIGIFLWRKGIIDANKELIPLQEGAVAKGEIIEIYLDSSKVINNQSPTVIKFSFEVGGRTCVGDVGNIFDTLGFQRQVGDQLWIVYMPEDPSISSVWPPLS